MQPFVYESAVFNLTFHFTQLKRECNRLHKTFYFFFHHILQSKKPPLIETVSINLSVHFPDYHQTPHSLRALRTPECSRH